MIRNNVHHISTFLICFCLNSPKYIVIIYNMHSILQAIRVFVYIPSIKDHRVFMGSQGMHQKLGTIILGENIWTQSTLKLPSAKEDMLLIPSASLSIDTHAGIVAWNVSSKTAAFNPPFVHYSDDGNLYIDIWRNVYVVFIFFILSFGFTQYFSPLYHRYLNIAPGLEVIRPH